jgi:hypothetical protein
MLERLGGEIAVRPTMRKPEIDPGGSIVHLVLGCWPIAVLGSIPGLMAGVPGVQRDGHAKQR